MLTSIPLFLIVTCLILSPPTRWRAADQPASAQEPKQTTITGIVVALGGRVIRDDGRCRQLMVVRAAGRGNGTLKNRYLLVPHNYDCNVDDFTNEIFQNKRKWRFPVIRGADCDSTFEQIKDMPVVSPEGVRRVTWMKLVPGNKGERMSLTQKLLCYELNGALKPVKRESSLFDEILSAGALVRSGLAHVEQGRCQKSSTPPAEAPAGLASCSAEVTTIE